MRDALLDELLADTERLVRCESPSADVAALARCADVVAEVGERRLGAAPERVAVGGRVNLRWFSGGTPTVLLVGHYDTVWPVGTLRTHPWAVDGDVLRGPGCYDMKAGLAMLFAALRDRPRGVVVVVTADEEIGSPTSRDLVEDSARGLAAALVLEGAGDGGALKTARKGVATYDLTVRGRAAHAGLHPERGVNATVELAHQVLAIAALGDAAAGTTVTPTLLSSGTTWNTVPASGVLHVDSRAATIAEQQRVDTALRSLPPRLPGARIHVGGGAHRPPFEEGMSRSLFERASGVAEGLGLGPLSATSVGGGSDGNLTAGVGTPTLDGLGAVGGGAHADDEHVAIDSLVPRTRLLSALVADLLGRPAAAS